MALFIIVTRILVISYHIGSDTPTDITCWCDTSMTGQSAGDSEERRDLNFGLTVHVKLIMISSDLLYINNVLARPTTSNAMQ